MYEQIMMVSQVVDRRTGVQRTVILRKAAFANNISGPRDIVDVAPKKIDSFITGPQNLAMVEYKMVTAVAYQVSILTPTNLRTWTRD